MALAEGGPRHRRGHGPAVRSRWGERREQEMGTKAQSLAVTLPRRRVSTRSVLMVALLIAAAVAIAILSFSWTNNGGGQPTQKAPTQEQPLQQQPTQDLQNPHAGAIRF